MDLMSCTHRVALIKIQFRIIDGSVCLKRKRIQVCNWQAISSDVQSQFAPLSTGASEFVGVSDPTCANNSHGRRANSIAVSNPLEFVGACLLRHRRLFGPVKFHSIAAV